MEHFLPHTSVILDKVLGKPGTLSFSDLGELGDVLRLAGYRNPDTGCNCDTREISGLDVFLREGGGAGETATTGRDLGCVQNVSVEDKIVVFRN